MDYALVPDEELPEELNELFASLGKQLGAIASGIVLSGEYAVPFYELLSASLTDAARYMKAVLNKAINDRGKPITKDDVLDMHRFLTDFDGDLGEE